MAEEVRKNKLKIPLETAAVTASIAEEDGFTPPPKPKKVPGLEKVSIKKEKEEKSEKAEKTERKIKQQATPKITLAGRLKKITSFFLLEQTQRITGLLFVFAAAYIGVACASYLFTWEADQDKVLGPSSVLFSPETRVQNWFGKLGALLSHLFMYKWFGVSSFLMVPLLLLTGISKALQREKFFSFMLWPKTIFVMLWSSVMLGFIFSDKLMFLGGGMGFILNNYLQGLMGNVGTLALLTLTGAGFAFLIFDFKRKEPESEV
ncbi:MAG TPA: DNA translocase FtsK 4TM domain-containing protein, partial [Bacteroidia bacterium]|nr:DNA translocase FtsK 4TM domain-containing protein [Bacteroidia bacterium]